jgi:hypothetical protein
MTSDDVLAYLASRPKKERPVVLRSDAAMLRAWLLLRHEKPFRDDVLCRHGLHSYAKIIETDHEHAIANAWSHCIRVLVKEGAE